VIDPVLSVRKLSVSLRREGRPNTVLQDVALDVFPGEIVGVLGESGSGKSSLGAAILGLLPGASEPAVSGSIILSGAEIVGATAATLRDIRRNRVRLVSQDPISALNPTMSIRDQLRESANLADRDIEDWLEAVGVDQPKTILRRYPHRLSGGQRQRVVIAMAMMARPDLLVADEPTTALDYELQDRIVELVRSIVRRQGTSALFITHDLEAAARICDRIVVLRDGLVVESGATSQVLCQPNHPYTVSLVAARRALAAPQAVSALVKKVAPPALRMSGVSKGFELRTSPTSRGQFEVLRDFELEVGEGECVGLLGVSGSGKSTVIRLAAGLLSPDRGRVERSGDLPQIVFQDAVSSLTPWITIEEQVAERLRPLRLSASERRRRIDEAFELTGLELGLGSELPGRLSVGQCQRAALARTIIVPPRLLLCDEPTSSLDASLAISALDLIGSLRTRFNMAVLFVTHDLAVAGYVADRLSVLSGGRVVDEGSPTDVIERLRPVSDLSATPLVVPDRLGSP